MATRRPPMPRAGSGNPGQAADKPAAPATAPAEAPKRPRTPASEPVQRAQPRPVREPGMAKVIPLGRIVKDATDAPEPSPAKPSSPQRAPKRAADPTPKAANPAKDKARKDKATKSPAKPKKPKSTDSERRIEDRNLLSGAVRKDEKAAKKQTKKDPEGLAKPIPARSFSGRILALSIAMSVFALLLVPSIGTYARQHEEIAALRASIAAKETERENLKDQIARWDDPLYIKQQARDRINLVMPGERNYMVVGSKPTDAPPVEENHSPNQIRTDLPWVDALFDSVQRAATD